MDFFGYLTEQIETLKSDIAAVQEVATKYGFNAQQFEVAIKRFTQALRNIGLQIN